MFLYHFWEKWADFFSKYIIGMCQFYGYQLDYIPTFLVNKEVTIISVLTLMTHAFVKI